MKGVINMAVLTREELMSRVSQRIGDDTSDDALSFLEDITDTYDALLPTNEEVDWKEKYEALDNEWRTRYRDRFYGGSENYETLITKEGVYESDEEADFSKDYTYDNLFKKEGE